MKGSFSKNILPPWHMRCFLGSVLRFWQCFSMFTYCLFLVVPSCITHNSPLLCWFLPNPRLFRLVPALPFSVLSLPWLPLHYPFLSLSSPVCPCLVPGCPWMSLVVNVVVPAYPCLSTIVPSLSLLVLVPAISLALLGIKIK